MPTPYWLTGFENGIVSVSGGGLFSSVTGTPAIVTTPVRTGARALEISASAAIVRLRSKLLGTPTVGVFRVYVRFNTLPTADAKVLHIPAATGTYPTLWFKNATGTWAARWADGDAFVDSGITVVANTWYRVDMKVDVSANPKLYNWQIDGAAQTQISKAGVATTLFALGFGTDIAQTFTCYYDDAFISLTAADYPIGASEIKSLSPDADGTHNPATPDCIRGGGASPALISGGNTAFQYMDDVPFPSGASPTTDRINQDITAGHTTHYVEVAFPDISETTINGVMGELAYGGDSTTANNGSTKAVRSDATEIDIYAGDMSETSVFYKSAIVTAPGGGWTQAEVNALKMRLGYSSGITPNPFWQALMFEVDTVPGAPPAGFVHSQGVIVG